MKWKTLLGWGLLLGLGAWTVRTLFQGQSTADVWAALGQVHPLSILAGLCLIAGFLSCEALCTHRILHALGHAIPFRQAMTYSLIGFYFSSVTPSASGGQPAQVLAMKQDDIPVAHGALDMLLVTFCYQTMTLLLAGAAWFYLPDALDLLGGNLRLLLLFGSAVTLALTAGIVLLLLRPPKSPRFDDYRAAAALLRSKPSLIPQALLLSGLQLLCLYLVPYVVCCGFGLKADPIRMAGVQALLSLSTGCLPLPGAVGVAESAFLRGFAAFFGTALTTPALLVSRGISFYLPLLLTGVMTLILRLRRRRISSSQSMKTKKIPAP